MVKILRTMMLVPLLVASSCASTFPYKTYIPKLPDFDGILHAKNPADDVQFSTLCEPKNGEDQCSVIHLDELEKIAIERADHIVRLKACETN